MSAQAEVIDEDVADLEAPIDYGSDRPEAKIAYPPKGEGSKWNALHHGLMAKKLFPADLAQEVEEHTAMLTEQFQPTNRYEEHLVGIMGRSGAQVERARNLMVANLQRLMDRAVLFWDSDRSAYIDNLAARLARDPVRVSRALMRTKQGVDWILKNWTGLENVLAVRGEAGWTDVQRKIAYDLMGVRPDYREGCPDLRPDSTAQEQAELVKREKKALEELLKNGLKASDKADQRMAQAGMPLEEDAWTKKLRKYTASNLLDFNRAKAELHRIRAEAAGAATATAKDQSATAATATEAAAAASASASAAAASGAAPGVAAASGAAPKGRRDPEPTPRPVPSKAAFAFLVTQSKRLGEDVIVPQGGAGAGAGSQAEGEAEVVSAARTPAPEEEWPVPYFGPLLADMDADEPALSQRQRPGIDRDPQTVSPACSAEERERRDRDRDHDRDRRRRRAQEKQARRAAARRRRR